MARVFVTEVVPGTVSLAALTEAQQRGGDGQFALAMAGYVSRLARRWDAEPQLTARLGDVRSALRDKARAAGSIPGARSTSPALASGSWSSPPSRRTSALSHPGGGLMASVADMLSQRDRERILERLAEWQELRRLAEAPPEPPDPDGDGQDDNTPQAPRTATSGR
jgi:hypothetical protein